MGPHPAVAAVRLAVRRSLSGLAPGDLVLLACSGGPDSVALAEAAAFEAPKAALRLGGLTVDHGLQTGSDRQAAEVADYLLRLGCRPVEALSVTVGSAGGPEAAARTARYEALAAAAERHGAAAVLLGHTRDDQAETVLLGLARGSGPRSLAGMSQVAGLYRRPLLDLPRQVTEAVCAVLGRSVWHDPHNQDPSYARVRVRGTVLPVLERELGPGIAEALARTAWLCRDDADALDEWAERAAPTCAHPDGGLDVKALEALPAAVRRRIIRRAVIAAGSPAGTLASVHVAAVDALVTRWRGQGPLQLPGGVTASRRYGRLLCDRDADCPANQGAVPDQGGPSRRDGRQPARDSPAQPVDTPSAGGEGGTASSPPRARLLVGDPRS